ncbi:MAG: DNA-binding domain-containing protein [Pseudomonadota bacterium]
MNLQNLQKNFANHIFTKADKKILSQVSYSTHEALERLNIYRNNVLGNFESVLNSIFPVTKKILGAEKFEELSQKYYRKFPSKSGDLNEYGKEFPKLLKNQEPLYSKDLAQLELLYHQAFFAKKTKEFDLKSFKKIAPENLANLIFIIDPAANLFTSKFAIFSIWKSEKKIKNFAKAESMLICADKILKLNEEELVFLTEIKKQKKLYQIYKKLCKTKETAKEIDIGKLINHFITNGVITSWN